MTATTPRQILLALTSALTSAALLSGCTTTSEPAEKPETQSPKISTVSTGTPPSTPPELTDNASEATSTEQARDRFNRINRLDNEAEQIAAYDDLWREYIDEASLDQREVAGRAAINLSWELNKSRQFERSVAITKAAFPKLMASSHPIIRSRAASLLVNQAVTWEGLSDRAEQSRTRQHIITSFNADTYPSTIYIVASAIIGEIDDLVVASDLVTAETRLNDFERDYILSGKLDEKPDDGWKVNCIEDAPPFVSAVKCISSEEPDVEHFKKYVALYRAKLASLKMTGAKDLAPATEPKKIKNRP